MFSHILLMLLCAGVHLYCIGTSLLEYMLISYSEIDVEENNSALESILSFVVVSV